MTITFSRLGDELYWGRLGNQMWEIASTIGIAVKNGQDFIFPYWKYNQFFGGKLPEGPPITNFPVYRYDNFNYEDIVIHGNADLAGYFQSWKYFNHCKELVKYYFNPIVYSLPQGSCSVHIRRGDYLFRSNFHTNLPFDYYREAISKFPRDMMFYIMSDDLTWCKENFDYLPNRVFSNIMNSELDDLSVMMSCENHIIANSSYSWWGAWLSPHEGKVIAPKNWWVTADSSDVCPPEWELI